METIDSQERAYIKKLCYLAAERLDMMHEIMRLVKMQVPPTKMQVELRLLGDHILECGTRPIIQAPVLRIAFVGALIGFIIGALII